MSFSPGQQGKYQPLVEAAWRVEAAQSGAAVKDKGARRAWYEAQLFAATGKRSTTGCNPKQDYEDAMAWFERIGPADSFEWQMKQATGNQRRLEHVVRQTAEVYRGVVVREIAPEFETTEAYIRGIASQALGFAFRGELRELPEEQLLVVLRALKIQVRRQDRRGQKTDKVRTLDEDPF